jgi:hypothetical protein
MTIRIATLVFMAALAGHAFAEEAAPPAAFTTDAYPPEVTKSLEYANAECAGNGGGKVTFSQDTVRKLDLTGGGRDDHMSISVTPNAPAARRSIAAPAAAPWIFW